MWFSCNNIMLNYSSNYFVGKVCNIEIKRDIF